MVGGTFQLARLLVDFAGTARAGQRRREQDVVDAKAAIEAKAHLPVVPPRVAFRRLLEKAKGIGQARDVHTSSNQDFYLTSVRDKKPKKDPSDIAKTRDNKLSMHLLAAHFPDQSRYFWAMVQLFLKSEFKSGVKMTYCKSV